MEINNQIENKDNIFSIIVKGVLILIITGTLCTISGVIIQYLYYNNDSNKQPAIDLCLKTAETNYISDWNKTCKSNNLNDNCTLPNVQAERLDKLRTENRNLCITRYK